MISWTWAFLDRPASTFEACAHFWATVTGSTLSPRRGGRDEFLTLLPASGPAWLKMQVIESETPGTHLDLDVVDVPRAVERAIALGAKVIAEGDDYTSMTSPAGQVFCFTTADPAPRELIGLSASPDGNVTRLDQICLDVSASNVVDETAFWRELTGWSPQPTPRPEFTRLRDPGQPLQFLLQRLDESRPPSAHPDLACTDVAATATWHELLGATFVADGAGWLVLRDPSGAPYCLTARSPFAG
ncbi:VOC family protein [Nocardia camponoti]|uniref:Glyoxalase-like domain-containing protein n=1 Tax=Nocardia camponoti TaxID=1616106 RepID=A0A917V5W3_9NOCA|nr:VOC family protein [Nocardia camponoti]GGK41263.1 hypothetical protein GCM10011591_10970 [Nocardia camponoti]